VVDLSDRLAGSVLQGLELYGDRMVAYTDQKAYQILIDQVQEPDVIDTTDKVVAGAFFDEMDNIVFLTAASKVIEYTDGNSQFADTAEVNWHSGVSVATYSSKIYILDPASNQIWRYQRGTESYGSAQAYFSSEIDLSDAVSIAVDGKMWVLKSDGTLLKYLSGEPVEYQVKKAPLNSFEGATKVFTELESNQVYILDSEDDRLFIFDKNGKNDDLTYNAQYVFEDLKGTLVDFTVDKDRNKLLLLTTEALYEMNFGD
jgi:hypothetical protein